MADDLDTVFDSVRVFMLRKFPGRALRAIVLEIDGDSVRLPASARCCVGTERARPAQATHSPDFRSLNWYGDPYKFSAVQAAVVKVLWEARDNGTPDVGQQALLEEAGSESTRLVDVFKRNEAWGIVIVPGESAGTYRLGERPGE